MKRIIALLLVLLLAAPSLEAGAQTPLEKSKWYPTYQKIKVGTTLEKTKTLAKSLPLKKNDSFEVNGVPTVQYLALNGPYDKQSSYSVSFYFMKRKSDKDYILVDKNLSRNFTFRPEVKSPADLFAVLEANKLKRGQTVAEVSKAIRVSLGNKTGISEGYDDFTAKKYTVNKFVEYQAFDKAGTGFSFGLRYDAKQKRYELENMFTLWKGSGMSLLP